MAELVLGIGSSHSPLLNSPAEDYPKHAEIDASGRKLIDKTGKARTYGELLELADPSIKDQIRPQVLEERAARCTANIARLESEIAAAKLDALIIIGDDQYEQFFDDNMPAILVYAGETITNNPLSMPDEAPQWWRRARSQYHVSDAPREYPVAADLARRIVEGLMENDFDISYSKKLSKAHGEGHAFGFVHQRLMRDDTIVPIVPIALNTYFAPNQPRPKRCYDLGRAIAEVVRAYDGAGRVGILGSGGLSHFTVDEELDRYLLDAFRAKDANALRSLSPERLNSGTSEVRNWITVAGACEHLDTKWQEYVPCYRSAAGTGCGMGFAVWA
ncbi:MAG: extradiol ring-cleavage dioxygenase [Beijerinckiaceae bacterium]|nr:extradiol ring-cleavage dioxygenase [Beijerinckiaceae bacterium]